MRSAAGPASENQSYNIRVCSLLLGEGEKRTLRGLLDGVNAGPLWNGRSLLILAKGNGAQVSLASKAMTLSALLPSLHFHRIAIFIHPPRRPHH